MFIFIAYKDAPELSHRRRSSELDISVDKTLLVNPDCPVRIMLEYIRKKCRLGIYTQFDLCDDTGALKGLFSLKTYAYATDQFEHKKTYYLIVIKHEMDRHYSILPQLNQEHKMYVELKARVKRFLLTGELSPLSTDTGSVA
ncbi:uncharacterized protein CXorf65-like [Trichoplusia ni]|uniref:Uncharacterized protein CXorf65-like n=1 Tax=Trichoplusia ni TaxID=7111 RepID=A0A7E5X0N1_TRINI|nr:uncharacterized protein CXorf65-like [Trichoplusia ni]